MKAAKEYPEMISLDGDGADEQQCAGEDRADYHLFDLQIACHVCCSSISPTILPSSDCVSNITP